MPAVHVLFCVIFGTIDEKLIACPVGAAYKICCSSSLTQRI